MNAPSKNNMATAGFILALFTFLFGWIPVFGWVTWILGVIFSWIGLSQSKSLEGKGRGLAIAGLLLSFAGLIMILIIASAVLAFLGWGAIALEL